jgi:hypothetical protein
VCTCADMRSCAFICSAANDRLVLSRVFIRPVKNSNGSRTLDDLHSHTELETSMMWLLCFCDILLLTALHIWH